MIAAVICVGNEKTYQSVAAPSISRQDVDGLAVFEVRNQNSIHMAYNRSLAEIRELNCETAILMHEDVSFKDSTLFEKIRDYLLSNPDVAVTGPVGALNVRSLAWWEGEMHGRVSDPFVTIDTADPYCDVDSLDGMFLALNRWSIHNLQFDPTYGGFHGYDAEICFQARSMGKRITTSEIPVFHHTKGGYGDQNAYRKAELHFAKKWMSTTSQFTPTSLI